MATGLTALTEDQLLGILRVVKRSELAPQSSPWMSPEETARYLGIALGTLRNWTSNRFIPFCKRGRVVRYNRDTIDRWLATGGCPGRTTLADS
jgi:excisionase family DNA binding protein